MGDMIMTNQDVIINVMGKMIRCSDGKIYMRFGNVLDGPFGIISQNVNSDEDAVNIIVGMYGGNKKI